MAGWYGRGSQRWLNTTFVLLGLVANLVRSSLAQAAPSQQDENPTGPYDVVLLLDNSTSMFNSDPEGFRLDAAQALLTGLVLPYTFCTPAPSQVTRMGAISFSGEAEVLIGVTPVVPIENTQAISQSLRLTYQQNSDFSLAIQAALNLFVEAKSVEAGRKRAIVLISDGKPRPRNVFGDQLQTYLAELDALVQDAQDSHVEFYIVWLGDEDVSRFQEYAGSEDHFFNVHALDDDQSRLALIQAFSKIGTDLALEPYTVYRGVTEARVGYYRTQLSLDLIKAGPGQRFVLYGPGEAGAQVQVNCDDPSVKCEVNDLHALFVVRDPAPGTWRYEITAGGRGAVAQWSIGPVDLRATFDQSGGSVFADGLPVRLAVKVTRVSVPGGRPVDPAVIQVRVALTDTTTSQIQRLPLTYDSESGESLFSTVVDNLPVGSYLVTPEVLDTSGAYLVGGEISAFRVAPLPRLSEPTVTGDLQVNTPVTVTVFLQNASALSASIALTGTATLASGSTEEIALRDDGLIPDAVANDGFYTLSLPANALAERGQYHVDIFLPRGTTRDGLTYEDRQDTDFVVHAPGEVVLEPGDTVLKRIERSLLGLMFLALVVLAVLMFMGLGREAERAVVRANAALARGNMRQAERGYREAIRLSRGQTTRSARRTRQVVDRAVQGLLKANPQEAEAFDVVYDLARSDDSSERRAAGVALYRRWRHRPEALLPEARLVGREGRPDVFLYAALAPLYELESQEEKKRLTRLEKELDELEAKLPTWIVVARDRLTSYEQAVERATRFDPMDVKKRSAWRRQVRKRMLIEDKSERPP